MRPAPYPKPSYLIAAITSLACVLIGPIFTHDSQLYEQSQHYPFQIVIPANDPARLIESTEPPPPGSTVLGDISFPFRLHARTVLGQPVTVSISHQYQIGRAAPPTSSPHQITSVNDAIREIAAKDIAAIQARNVARPTVYAVLHNHPPLSQQTYILWPAILRVVMLMLASWPLAFLLVLLAERLRWVDVFRLAHRRVVCPFCQYPLVGLPERICPECGHGVNPPPQSGESNDQARSRRERKH